MASLWRSINSVQNKHSNFESFMESITPVVPQKQLPKSCIRDLNAVWHQQGKEEVEFFTLGDLWDQYKEWSAYGTGVPVTLNTGEEIVQYYVPYLSAIQIYTSKTPTTLSARSSREDSSDTRSPREDGSEHVEFETDSWTDESEGGKLVRSLSDNSSKFWDAMSEDSSFEQEGGGDLPAVNRLGNLYLQYFEVLPPRWRVPLMDKITEMARTHPGLLSLRNVDLAPASWMAVAWYPIYHIPAGRIVKDLSACFLTFHTLSSSLQDDVLLEDKVVHSKDGLEGETPKSGVPLPPFGLSTYKMDGEVWADPKTEDLGSISILKSAADSWLKQLGVNQFHDFTYFLRHPSTTNFM